MPFFVPPWQRPLQRTRDKGAIKDNGDGSMGKNTSTSSGEGKYDGASTASSGRPRKSGDDVQGKGKGAATPSLVPPQQRPLQCRHGENASKDNGDDSAGEDTGTSPGEGKCKGAGMASSGRPRKSRDDIRGKGKGAVTPSSVPPQQRPSQHSNWDNGAGNGTGTSSGRSKGNGDDGVC